MIYLRLPASLAYRDVVMRVISGACALASGLREGVGAPLTDGPLEERVLSAVGEAFNNVVLHAYRGTHGEVAIEIEASAQQIEIRVIDFGVSFDPTHVPEPALEDLPESGMGLFIMRRCMDEVTYAPGPPNVLRMLKRIGETTQGEGVS